MDRLDRLEKISRNLNLPRVMIVCEGRSNEMKKSIAVTLARFGALTAEQQ